MKMSMVLFVLFIPLLLIGCATENSGPNTLQSDSQSPKGSECNTDSDCTTGGCSGVICESINEEPMMTTCEWLEEYECYRAIDCGCIDGKCAWKKDDNFQDCVDEKRAQPVDEVLIT